MRNWSLASTCQCLSSFSTAPLGPLLLAAAMAVRTLSRDSPYWLMASGLRSTRTAGSELPPMLTCPTPCTCDSFGASTVEARSYISPRLWVSEVRVRTMIGMSEGLALR